MMENTEKKTCKWYHLPTNKWFNNRKEVKEYLGGNYYFSIALSKRDVIFVPNN